MFVYICTVKKISRSKKKGSETQIDVHSQTFALNGLKKKNEGYTKKKIIFYMANHKSNIYFF